VAIADCDRGRRLVEAPVARTSSGTAVETAVSVAVVGSARRVDAREAVEVARFVVRRPDEATDAMSVPQATHERRLSGIATPHSGQTTIFVVTNTLLDPASGRHGREGAMPGASDQSPLPAIRR
jgi:hypothetical protein